MVEELMMMVVAEEEGGYDSVKENVGGIKSQYPTRARQVAARAFSRGWMSVRGHRDAHSEISIERKTPTPHILDGWKNCCSSSSAMSVEAADIVATAV